MKYRTIVVDPPWDQPTAQLRHWDKFASVAVPYESMSVEAIAGMPVADLAYRDCRLFLWTTNRFLPDAFRVMEAWGFGYRQTLVWEKPAAPIALHVARSNSEFLLVGVRGAPARTGTWPVSVVQAAQPHRGGAHHGPIHSAKPDVFLDLIESVSPGPYLELFARRNRLGWDTWGNEALEHISLPEEVMTQTANEPST